jgi:aryl-phospho-beta-D-glucosidase BglC (GH1 family)
MDQDLGQLLIVGSIIYLAVTGGLGDLGGTFTSIANWINTLINPPITPPHYDCSICGASFTSPEALTSHIASTHPTPPPGNIPNPSEWYGFAYSSSAYTYSTSAWTAALDKAEQWNFNVIRVPIMFSTYSFQKLDAVVNLIASRGMYAVLDEHPWKTDLLEPRVGSAAWISEWSVIANHYRDNPAVIGYELINEPYAQIKDPSVTTDATMQAMIHTVAHNVAAINPQKYIVMPQPNYVGQYTQSYTDMKAVLSLHPYGWPTQTNWEDLKAIADSRFTDPKFVNSKTKFAWVYISEIEGHPTSSGGSGAALELQYVTYIIDKALSSGYGFALWHYETPTDDGGVDQNTALQNSNYNP